MAVAEKGKRRIRVGDRIYLWRVFEDWDQAGFDGVQVTVVAKDQRLFVRYGVEQSAASRTAVVSRGSGSPHRRMPCPRFEGENGILTPQGVRALIEWSLTVG